MQVSPRAPPRQLAPTVLALAGAGLAALLVVSLAHCGDEESTASQLENLLQDSCVRDFQSLPRTEADGSTCNNKGQSVCSGFASTCINFCAWEVCQPINCTDNSHCSLLGDNFTCEDWVVDGVSYGLWCRPGASCEAGTFCDGVTCCTYICVAGERVQQSCRLTKPGE